MFILSELGFSQVIPVKYSYTPSDDSGIVFLAGSFNNWANNQSGHVTDPNFKMDDPDSNGVFTKVEYLNPGTYEYKFVTNINNWHSDPLNPVASGSNNNSVIVVTDPMIYYVSPMEGAVISDSRPEIYAKISFSDENGIDISSLKIYIDNIPVSNSTSYFDSTTRQISYTPGSSLSDGEHSVYIEIKNSSGETASEESSFNVLQNYEIISIPLTFELDTRSYILSIDREDISSVYLMGEFNEWTTTNPMSDSDDDGIWTTTITLDEGEYQYKFLINGSIWINDPDNPVISTGGYDNSIIEVFRNIYPEIEPVYPLQGALLNEITGLDFQIGITPGDPGYPVDESSLNVLLNGEDILFDYNSAGSMVSGSTGELSEGIQYFKISMTDTSGISNDDYLSFGIFGENSGYHYVDNIHDDEGTGKFVYPDGVPGGSCDILSFSIETVPTYDSLKFTIQFRDLNEFSLTGIQINNILNSAFDNPVDNIDINTPMWENVGVFIYLLPESSSYFDNSYNNHIFFGPDSFTETEDIILIGDPEQEDKYVFKLSLSILETYLGTFNEWYFIVFSTLPDIEGTGDFCYEILEKDGGISGEAEPDIYDALFFDSKELQYKILSNYISSASGEVSRTSTLDSEGRGILKITPAMVSDSLTVGSLSVRILTPSASIYEASQDVYVHLNSMDFSEIYTNINENESPITVTDSIFSFNVTLEEGDNTIQVKVIDNEGKIIYSNPLKLNLIIDHNPQAVISDLAIESDRIVVDGSGSYDPDNESLTFAWSSDSLNPELISFSNSNSDMTDFTVPSEEGEYYLNLNVSDTDGNTDFARTYFQIKGDSVILKDINDNAEWVMRAVIYEIYVRSFSTNGVLSGVESKLDSIKALGADCIWFMPVFEGPSSHGYSITDYYNIESDYGTNEDFRKLVNEAHKRGLKVILDFVGNHTSDQHPFMESVKFYGEYSHYYDFYERRIIGSDNGMGMYLSSDGLYTYYSNWFSLPNVNLSNEFARDYFTDVARHWILNYDVDGFRCDAAWGPEYRYGTYWQEWRSELKRIKPEVLLLAEAPATNFTFFEEKFDLAYDWNLYGKIKETVDYGDIRNLHEAIINYGYAYPENAYPFRFLENHDEDRFINQKGLQKTKLAAALIFSVPGIPLIYAGQEVGETSMRGTISWSDPYNMKTFYRKLIQIRKENPVFYSKEIQKIGNSDSYRIYSFIRTSNDSEDIGLAVLNFNNTSKDIKVYIPDTGLGDGNYYLNEMLNEEAFLISNSDLDSLDISLEAYEAKIYVISDKKLTGIYENEFLENDIINPEEYRLFQNYPNPFNGSTKVKFSLKENSELKLFIYNILGQKVKTLVEGQLQKGKHTVIWNGTNDIGENLSSGLYFCRMVTESFIKTVKMVYIK